MTYGPTVCAKGTTGIYKIEVLRERKSYIGQSLDVQRRMGKHWIYLSIGMHPNPELQQHWKDYGANQFRASLVETAPNGLGGIKLARWLVGRERHWIEQNGGMRNVINAVFPEPVLNEVAREELNAERLQFSASIGSLENSIENIDKQIAAAVSKREDSRKSVAAAQKWWGLLASEKVLKNAESAESEILSLDRKIDELWAELESTQTQLKSIKDHLFL